MCILSMTSSRVTRLLGSTHDDLRTACRTRSASHGEMPNACSRAWNRRGDREEPPGSPACLKARRLSERLPNLSRSCRCRASNALSGGHCSIPRTNASSVSPDAVCSPSPLGDNPAPAPRGPDGLPSPPSQTAEAPDLSTDQSLAALGPLTPSSPANLPKCGRCSTPPAPGHTAAKASRKLPYCLRSLALKHRKDILGATVPRTTLDTTRRSITPLFSDMIWKSRWPSKDDRSTDVQSSSQALRPSWSEPGGGKTSGDDGTSTGGSGTSAGAAGTPPSSRTLHTRQ
mmetsp:Transcript_12599/g.39351  ORF Transcript_12599/g.39351 Transcript_12599/m.39351 type:complete len:286 (+) Transcript_12599:354-1211(+)